MDSHNKELASAAAPEELEELSQLLGTSGIPFTISRDKSVFNPTFSFSDVDQRVRLCVAESDYGVAMEVLGLKETPLLAAEMEYLSGFEIVELRELLVEEEKWELNYRLAARELLKQKGSPVDESWLQNARKQYLSSFRKPKSAHWGLWLCAIPLCLVGAPAAMALAAFIFFGYGTDPTGKKYKLYSEDNRTLALLLMVVSGLSFLIGIWAQSAYYGAGGLFFETGPSGYY